MEINTAKFIKIFNGIAPQKHRYAVFSDFITMAAISLRNALHKDEKLETEYMGLIANYTKEEAQNIAHLLGELVMLLEAEPKDVLGQIYMNLDLGNSNTGQFFTPSEISLLLAKLIHGAELESLDTDFITLSEPACGAGGMVLAFVNVMIENGHNPAKSMWVQCVDVDRIAALMCYIQLTLWHVPAQVIVGNSLSLDVQEIWYTPAHYMEFWNVKLQRREQEEALKKPALDKKISPVQNQPVFNQQSPQFDFKF